MNTFGLLCISILFLLPFVPILETKSGPFKAALTRVGPCSNPTEPLDTDPPAYFYGELYNTTTDINLMRGNVTVVKNHKIKKMKAKSYIWENSKWKVSYMLNNMGCNRIIFPVLSFATGVKYEVKTCTFLKGEYLFSGYNVDKVQHSWMSVQEYGKIMWRVEVFSQIGSVFCYDFETIIEPK